MIGLDFLATRSLMDSTLGNFFRRYMSDNLTDTEKKNIGLPK
jgi:hypothetical protein